MGATEESDGSILEFGFMTQDQASSGVPGTVIPSKADKIAPTSSLCPIGVPHSDPVIPGVDNRRQSPWPTLPRTAHSQLE